MIVDDCLICGGTVGDEKIGRVHVWDNELWRVSTSPQAPVLGFSYLEPKRHIPHITELDGPEAESLGRTLAGVTSALKLLTSADIVYVNVFGERIAHLHFNIAPHRAGDPLTGGRGMIEEGGDEIRFWRHGLRAEPGCRLGRPAGRSGHSGTARGPFSTRRATPGRSSYALKRIEYGLRSS